MSICPCDLKLYNLPLIIIEYKAKGGNEMEKLNVCLVNDSFPPDIDGVANAVVNYARIINEGRGSAVVVAPANPQQP